MTSANGLTLWSLERNWEWVTVLKQEAMYYSEWTDILFKEGLNGGGPFDGWRLKISRFDGWRLNFSSFDGWRLSFRNDVYHTNLKHKFDRKF